MQHFFFYRELRYNKLSRVRWSKAKKIERNYWKMSVTILFYYLVSNILLEI